MPFVSKSQRRACYAQQALDSKSKWDCGEFEAATPKGAKLPEHKTAMSTLDVVNLYAKDEADWDDADKTLAEAFGRQLAAFAIAKTASQNWPQKLRRLLERRGELPSQTEVVDGFHNTLKAELKQAAVSELIRVTASDTAPTGNEVHPPLLANPYLGTDREGAKQYENGYQHAQEQGHMALSTAAPDQWAAWQRNPRPWVEGFTAGASSVGSAQPHKVSMQLPSMPALRSIVNWAPAIGAGLGAGAGYLSRDKDESGVGSAIRGGLRGAASGTVVRFLSDGIAGPAPVSPGPAPAPDAPPTVYPPGSPADRAAQWMRSQINDGSKVSMFKALDVLQAKTAGSLKVPYWAPALLGAGLGASVGMLDNDGEEPLWRSGLRGAVTGGVAGTAIPLGTALGMGAGAGGLGALGNAVGSPDLAGAGAHFGLVAGGAAGLGAGIAATNATGRFMDWVLPGGQTVSSDKDLSATGAKPA